MNASETKVIKNVIQRLRGKSAAPETLEALTGPARLYLESWVIPALEILVKEDRRPHELKDAVNLSN